MLAVSFFFAICYVADEVISILLRFQGSVKMQASILSLVFKLAELIFIKAHNSINKETQSTPRLEFTHNWGWSRCGLGLLLATQVWTCGSSRLMVAPGLGTWFATWLWSCCPSRLMVALRLGTWFATRLWTC
jgi:hypothetical protein